MDSSLPGPLDLVPSIQEKALHFGKETWKNASDDSSIPYLRSIACLISSGNLIDAGGEDEKMFHPRKVSSFKKWVERDAQKRHKEETKEDKVFTYTGDRFKKEPVAGFGTAFLVGPKHMLTAAHCVLKEKKNENDSDCLYYEETRVVFDFKGSMPIQDYTFEARQIYKIQGVVDYLKGPNDADWALIELDRSVEGDRPPISIGWDEMENGSPICMVGHSNGLPLKLVKGYSRKDAKPNLSETRDLKIDAFGGNSGSPIFKINRDKTHTLVGMLISGVEDYRRDEKNGEVHLNEATDDQFEYCQAFNSNTNLYRAITHLFAKEDDRVEAAYNLGSAILQGDGVKALPKPQMRRAANLFQEAFDLSRRENVLAGYNQGYCLYRLDEPVKALEVFEDVKAKSITSEDVINAINSYVKALENRGITTTRYNTMDETVRVRSEASVGSQTHTNANTFGRNTKVYSSADRGGTSLVEKNTTKEGCEIANRSGLSSEEMQKSFEDFFK